MDQSPNPNAGLTTQQDEVAFEFTSGGMLVQKRETSGEPTIKITVHHEPKKFDYIVHPLSTFGDLKRRIAIDMGMDQEMLKLYFRGQEKEDNEYLHNAGVKDNAKLSLMVEKPKNEVPTNPEPTHLTVEEITQLMADLEAPSIPEESQEPELSRASIAIAEVRSEVDKLAEQVAALEEVINSGTKVEEKQFIVLTEFLMRKLLTLDSIEAEGEEKVQRKIEVRRIQKLEEKLDTLKERNCKR